MQTKGLQIFRILPRSLGGLQDSWINDRIRYSYDCFFQSRCVHFQTLQSSYIISSYPKTFLSTWFSLTTLLATFSLSYFSLCYAAQATHSITVFLSALKTSLQQLRS